MPVRVAGLSEILSLYSGLVLIADIATSVTVYGQHSSSLGWMFSRRQLKFLAILYVVWYIVCQAAS